MPFLVMADLVGKHGLMFGLASWSMSVSNNTIFRNQPESVKKAFEWCERLLS